MNNKHNNGLEGFDDGLEQQRENHDQNQQAMEDQWKNSASQVKNSIKSATHSITGNGRLSAKVGTKLSGLRRRAFKTGGKMVVRGVKFIATILSKIIQGLIQLFALLGVWGLVIVAVIAFIALFAGLIINRTYSRTTEDSYQQVNVTDTNRVMSNDVASNGNVFFNPETHRYELAKNKTPTQANKLYYIYYSVMAEESRWYVLYQRNDYHYHGYPGHPCALGENKDAGKPKDPYWKPMDFSPHSHAGKETLDGRLFNASNIQDIANDKSDPFHMKGANGSGDQITKESDLFNDDTMKAVQKLSLDANMLYILDSSLNGTMLGTGKSQMFYAEQFVKPVAHDKDYNFKALDKYEDMDSDQIHTYGYKSHGDYIGSGKNKKYIDGSLEQKFEPKYQHWTYLLDAQNKSRGGKAPTGQQNNSAQGISNPILAKAFAWGESQVHKGIFYSMGNRLGPKSYDCSGFVTTALTQGGMKGVKGLNTVGILEHSNAFGQHGHDFKQVPLNSAKKGDIIVCGGLGGGGAAGHVFFLGENYHGDSTKVLECSCANVEGNTNGGVNDVNTFKWSASDGKAVALEPASGGSGGGDSSSAGSESPDGSSSSAKKDLSMATPSVYGNKCDSGTLEAASREFDIAYNPDIATHLYAKENDIKYKVWHNGDFYVDKDVSDVDFQKIANHTGNSQFTTAGPITNKDGKAKSAKDSNYLTGYTKSRGQIVRWCLQKGYNPAFIISLIYALTDEGQANFEGTKYNFLNQEILNSASSNSASSSSAKSSSSSSSSPVTSASSSSKVHHPEDLTGDDTDDGAEYYNLSYKINTVEDGLNAIDAYLNKHYKNHPTASDAMSALLNSPRKRRMFNDAYGNLTSGSPTLKLSDKKAAGDVAANNFYVYSTNAKDCQNPKNLAVVSDAKKPDGDDKPADQNLHINVEKDGTNDTTFGSNNTKTYYTKTTYVSQSPAVIGGTASKEHPYAIKRIDASSCGKQELKDYCYYYNVDHSEHASESELRSKVEQNLKDHPDQDAETERGVWDYGFGSILKLDDSEYYVWGIVEKNGEYYKVPVYDPVKGGNPGANPYQGVTLRHVNPKAKFGILGVTTPVGSINVGNQAAEDSDKVMHAISQLPTINDKNAFKSANDTKKQTDIKSVIDSHKLDTNSPDSAASIAAMDKNSPVKPDFYVTDMPSISGNDYKLTDMAGSDYIEDYLRNYTTYVPSIIDGQLDVVQRWKKMSYHSSAQDQTATDRVIGMIDSLIKNGNSGDNGDSMSNDGNGGSASANEQKIYDDFIKEGVGTIGAVGIMTNMQAECSFQAMPSGNPTHFGMFQMTSNLWSKENSWCKSHGKDPKSIDGQIAYVCESKDDPGMHQAMIMAAQSKSPQEAANGWYECYELHGYSADQVKANWHNNPANDSSANGNNPTGHTSKAACQKIWDAVVKGNPVAPDLNKLGASGDDSTDGGDRDSSQSTTNSDSWWGYLGQLKALLTKYFYNLKTTIANLFSGSEQGLDPTMFAENQTYNDKTFYVLDDGPNGKVGKAYPAGSLITNGADAYTWRQYTNELSERQTQFVLRQLVAAVETRDCRPVYYDEVWETFNEFDLGRILEENIKQNLITAFQASAGDTLQQNSPNNNNQQQNKVDPNTHLSDGDLKKMKIVRNYGWYKDKNGKMQFENGMILQGKPGGPVNALKPGRVELAQDGCVVIRTDGNTEQLAYDSLGKVNVSVGQEVKAGQQIGTLDNSGKFKLMDLDADYKCYGKDGTTPQLPKGGEAKGNGYTGCYNPATLFTSDSSNIDKSTEKTNGYYGNTKPSKSKVHSKTHDSSLGALMS